MFKVHEKDLWFLEKTPVRQWSIVSGILLEKVTQWDSISSICSISQSISLHNNNSTDQAIATDWYQSYFRNHDNVFSGKQKAAAKTDSPKMDPGTLPHWR